MSTRATPESVAQEWFQKVWNEKDEATIDRLLNPKGDVYGLSTNDGCISGKDTDCMTGPEEFKVFHRTMLSAMPDTQVTLTRIISQEDWVAVRFVITATHTGPGLKIAATGKKVRFTGMCMGRVSMGQWVEGWNTIDSLTLYQQLEAV